MAAVFRRATSSCSSRRHVRARATRVAVRSALVGAAQRAIEDGGSATVQPVAIAYKRMLGLPLGRQHRPLVAWYGGTVLLPHLKRVLSEGGIDVNVVFGPARTLSASDNRKAATQQAGELVRKLVAAVNGGRDLADVLVAAESEAALTLQARRRENRPAEAAE